MTLQPIFSLTGRKLSVWRMFVGAAAGQAGTTALLPAASPGAAAETVALSISPPLVELAVVPGEVHTFPITLTNDGGKTLLVSAQLLDMELDANGNPAPKPAGSASRSAAPWVRLADAETALLPGKQKQIRCHVRTARESSGGRYGVLLFTARQETGEAGNRIYLETQTGTILLLTAARTEQPGAEAIDFQALPGDDAKPLFTARLRNTGNTHLRAAGRVLIRGDRGRVLARLKLEGGTGIVLPEGTRLFRARSRRGIPPGHYQAEVCFTAPGLRAAHAAFPFQISAE